MQNDKEFLSDLFKTLGQSMSDGIELDESVSDSLKKVCAHRWEVVGWSESEQANVLECRTCQETRIEEQS